MPVRDEKDVIVIAESDVALIRELTNILRPLYKIWIATTKEQLQKQLLGEQKPNLILMGVSVTEFCGIQLCAKIKSNPLTATLPVVFISTPASAHLEEDCFAAGGGDFLVHPFVSTSLLARVRTHLALASQSQELQRQVEARTQELKHSKIKLIHRLGAAAEYRDDESSKHLERMAHYCYIIAKGYGANTMWCDDIYYAAPLHDIGKIALPDTVLQNMGQLSDTLMRQMQQHCEVGAKILHDDEEPILKMAASIAYHHHERFDGSGYPQGLVGDQIPIEARIAAIADTFDAMQTNRSYRKSIPVEGVVNFINAQAGQLFDPQLVRVFNDVLPDLIRVKSEAKESA